MSVDLIKFMGATVKSFSCVAGWQEQSSQIRIELVEDIDDSFQNSDIGTPQHFVCSGFVFDGIVKSIEYSESTGGKIHSVLLTAPTELLDGTQVILGSYNGAISGVKNVFNVFGYWENQLGFGGSSINDQGMVWEGTEVYVSGNPLDTTLTIISGGKYGIKPAIEVMQLPSYTGSYGEGIKYKNNHYIVNLSGLPVPLEDYRIGNGSSMSLRELIDIECHDGGNDYLVKLNYNPVSGEPHTIDIVTVDRTIEPDPNKIQEFLLEKSGLVNSWSSGKEMRFDETNLFLIGGDVHQLMLQENSSNIIPYWGYDVNNQIILGAGSGSGYNVNLNSVPIFDIIGQNSYNIDHIEMRLALHSYDLWAGYVQLTKPTLAVNIGLPSAFSISDGIFNRRLNHDFVQQNAIAATAFGARNADGEFVQKSQILYQFVRNYIQENYGRKFLVATPTAINFKIENGTNRVVYSWEPTDSAYTNDGASPLGINIYNEDYIKGEDGRISAFVKYSNTSNIDPTSIINANFLIQGTDIYVPCRILHEYGIIYVNGVSSVVISIDTPLFYKADDSLGGVEHINAAFGININNAANIRAGYIPGRLHPETAIPVGVAIPMKSNEYSYGPWYTNNGPEGRVEFRKEDGLVPWQYGGYELMNAAAQSYLDNFVTQTQSVENARIAIAGYPERSLGEVLVSGGPIITSVNTEFSDNGIITNYELRTYTPLKGQFSRDLAERIRRYGMGLQHVSKIMKHAGKQNITSNIQRSNRMYAFMGNTSMAVDYGYPHCALVGHLIQNPDNTGQYIPLVSVQTHEETVGNIRVDNTDIYSRTSCVGLEGIFRSFIAGYNIDNNKLPFFDNPRGGLVSGVQTSENMNPFQPGNDMEWLLNGINTYSGLHNRKVDDSLPYQQKPLGVRGPIVLNGWGWDLVGNPTPNASGESSTAYTNLSENSFTDNYLKKSNEWKTGPVELRWDDIRKLWCSPYPIWGKFSSTVNSKTYGDMRIYINDVQSSYYMKVYNPWSSSVESNMLVKADPDLLNNRYSIGSVDCVS